ncbi:MAG: thermonuclease family protein [Candidatus Thiodiazotropha sp. (ex Monitilora ramsayi)]|nr:thermonuclease family protein [Candidatus Thiodiazotropha sp. (ex Monitilora ramsayi)]
MLCFFLSAVLPLKALSSDGCLPPPDTEKVEVVSVLDGDTLRLRDGRIIRLIGIDTPELGRDGRPDMAGATEAKAVMQRLIGESRNLLYLRKGREKRDRHRRWLAHLYTFESVNISAEMLRRGLGYQITVPPNLAHLSCYRSAETEARKSSSGLWRYPVRSADSLAGDETGFHILRGKIERVGRSRSAVWLNLAGGLAIRITWGDWAGFPLADPDELIGRHVEFRGWLYQRNGEQRVRIRHPASIDW